MKNHNNSDMNTVAFAEKHPRTYACIVLLFLILAIAATTYMFINLIEYIVETSTKLILWVSNKLSKVDVVIIVALITGAVSITGIVLSSIVAKALEYRHIRREYLAKKREEPYSEFIEMIYKTQQSTKPGKSYPQSEMIEDLLRFSKQITLWGSPQVVRNWVKFKEIATRGDSGIDNLLITEKLMNEMRHDLGLPRTKKGNLLAFFVNDIKDALKHDRK